MKELLPANPNLKEGPSPATAGDLLIMYSSNLSKVSHALIGSRSGPIAILKSRAKRADWLTFLVASASIAIVHNVQGSRFWSDCFLILSKKRFF